MSLIKKANVHSAAGRNLALAAAVLGWLFDGFEIGLFPVIARPALKSMFDGTVNPDGFVGMWMGYITAAFLVGAALGGAAFGWLGDRVGRVRAMSLSILTYSLFSGLGYFAAEPWHFVVVRFMAALGMGGEWALGVALVMEIWPERFRPWLAGFIGSAANVGMLLVGVLASYWHVTEENWRWLFLVGASPALLTFLIRLFVPESEKWEHAQDVKKAENDTQSPLSEVFGSAYLKRTLIGIVLAAVALIGTWGSVQWIPLWADQLAHDNAAKASAHNMSSIGAVIGALAAPVLLGRLSRRLGYTILCVLSLVICAILFRGIDTYNTTFLLVTLLVGAITASFYGFFPMYLPEFFPTKIRATGQGICFNAGRLIAAVGVIYSGELVKSFNGDYAKMGGVITLVYIIGIIFIWLAPETKGKSLDQ